MTALRDTHTDVQREREEEIEGGRRGREGERVAE